MITLLLEKRLLLAARQVYRVLFTKRCSHHSFSQLPLASAVHTIQSYSIEYGSYARSLHLRIKRDTEKKDWRVAGPVSIAIDLQFDGETESTQLHINIRHKEFVAICILHITTYKPCQR